LIAAQKTETAEKGNKMIGLAHSDETCRWVDEVMVS
jgi:hypothetical protein